MLARLHALHEQVGNPVRRVHVVRAAAVVAGVLAQLEEVEDVVVPGLQVGAAGALALAALVDGDELVVVQLQERDDALGLAVGAADVARRCRGPRSRSRRGRRPTSRDRRSRRCRGCMMLSMRVVDVVEVAGGELRVQRAGVEERRRAAAEAAALVEAVEGDDARLAVALLVEAEAHRHAHPEELRRLDAAVPAAGLVDDQVAVIERLDAEEVELEVGGRDRGRRRAGRGRSRAGAG